MIRAFVKLHHPLQGYLRLQRRVFSVKAIYSSFPASLVYYSPRHRSSLFDHKEHESRPDDLYEEGVLIAQDGLVYPSVRPVSNGAVMFPNTFMMQEYVRRYFDELLDRQEDGREADKPWIYTIRKGTPIPSHLVLINEFVTRFSLQPSRGMALQDFNQSLDGFFDKHAAKEDVGEWLDSHPFQSATADDADAVWTAK